jgi:hypothetical protein
LEPGKSCTLTLDGTADGLRVVFTGDALPTQTGHEGMILHTDGENTYWANWPESVGRLSYEYPGPERHRFWRLYGSTAYGGNYTNMAEIELYNSIDEVSWNLDDAVITGAWPAAWYDGNPASVADYGTFTGEVQIDIDFTEDVTKWQGFDTVRMLANPAVLSGAMESRYVEYSDDGVTYTGVLSHLNDPSPFVADVWREWPIDAGTSTFTGFVGFEDETVPFENPNKLLALDAEGRALRLIDPPTSLPPGGTEGYFLGKLSGADGDAGWLAPPEGGGGGGGGSGEVGPHRYWALLGLHASAGDANMQLSGLKVRSTVGGDDLTGITTTSNSEYDSSLTAANLTDGDDGTKWAALGTSASIFIDLGEALPVAEIVLRATSDYGNQAPAHGQIAYSDDGDQWVVISGFGRGGWANGEEYPIAVPTVVASGGGGSGGGLSLEIKSAFWADKAASIHNDNILSPDEARNVITEKGGFVAIHLAANTAAGWGGRVIGDPYVVPAGCTAYVIGGEAIDQHRADPTYHKHRLYNATQSFVCMGFNNTGDGNLMSPSSYNIQWNGTIGFAYGGGAVDLVYPVAGVGGDILQAECSTSGDTNYRSQDATYFIAVIDDATGELLDMGGSGGGGGSSDKLASAKIDCTDPDNPSVVAGVNVASVTKTGTGLYRIAFTNPIDVTNAGIHTGGRWGTNAGRASLTVSVERLTGNDLEPTHVDLSTTNAGTDFDCDGWFSFTVYDVSIP